MAFRVEMTDTFSMYRIKNEGQGPVPIKLRGLYTSKDMAKQAINSYERIVSGRIRNAKTKRNSSG